MSRADPITPSRHPPSLADLLEAIAELREVIETRLLPPTPAPAERVWLTTGKAAQHAGVTLQCVRNWAKPREYGGFEIGQRVGREWRIDPDLLEALLAERRRG